MSHNKKRVFRIRHNKGGFRRRGGSQNHNLQTNSFNIANPKKKNIHLLLRISHPWSVNEIDLPISFFKTGSFVKYLPKIRPKPNKMFIIVGLI